MATSLIIGSALVCFVSYRSASHEIDELFDAQLTQISRLLNNLIELHQAMPAQSAPLVIKGWLPNQVFEEGKEATSLGHEYERKFAFQVWDKDKQLILRSQSAPDAEFSHFQPGYENVTLAGEGWRVFTLFDEAYGYWLQVAEHNEIRDELVEHIVLNLILPFLIGIPFVCLICGFIIHRSFLSLNLLKNHLQKSNPERLSTINIVSQYKEVGLVIDALNELLIRNKDMINKEKHFIEDAAHELRTPLSVIKIYAQELQALEGASDQKDILNKLMGAIERSERMTNQLLTTFRLGLSESEIELGYVNLTDIVREALEEVAPLALEKNQRINFNLEGESTPTLGERTLLYILVKNLIDNAIQYSGQHKEINVNLIYTESQAIIEVVDNGPGIDEISKKRIFNRFYRINSGDTKGAGLGLSIVKQISDIHQANVFLSESETGSGLKVSVHLKHENFKVADKTLSTQFINN